MEGSDAVMEAYQGRTALVTGGLGFIGSNLVHALTGLGARVIVVDPAVPGCGANPHNLEGVGCEVASVDLAEAGQLGPLLRRANVVFNLAGEISHGRSMSDPERDLRLNGLAQLRFLEECARQRPGVRVVYAGTRQVYGAVDQLPVDEDQTVSPVDYNGVHKWAAATYHLLLTRLQRLDAVVLRLSNVYGPRMALNVPGQGFLGVFFRRALLGEPIEVWGDGTQLRDPMHVSDAVQAFLLAGAWERPPHRTYNVGGPEALTLRQIAERIASLAEGVTVAERAFPPQHQQVDIGSYVSDCRRIQRALGWTARVPFAEGAAETLAFYRARRNHYLPEVSKTAPA